MSLLKKILLLALILLSFALPVLAQGGQAELLTSTGWEFLRNGQYKDAMMEFEKALLSDPGNLRAAEGLGKSAMQISEWARAKKGFDIAHNLKPDDCKTTANLAYVEMRLKHVGVARRLYEQVLGKPGVSGCDPNDNYSKNQLATLYFRSKDPKHKDLAIQHFNQLLNTETENKNILFSANFYLGQLYKQRKNYKKAVELMEKAFKIMPDRTNGRYDLGVLYFNTEDYDSALEHLNIAFAEKANDFNINLMLGLCYYNKDDDSEAITYLQKAVNLVKLMKPADQPKKNLPHRYLADLYRGKGEPGKAIRTCDAGLRISKNKSEKAGLICSKAKALEDRGKYEEALELFESVMSDSRWGSYARQQARRQEDLIERRSMGG
ncbi:MAG: tetratricopeptide repeat protein [Candidatus Krumholzibacteria bacterium]|jgi:tetratricopeptide (TPR) repeat protein|nr:tetratricopeptide repeat protein [Candidatus Krumholzibacteria bacterium]MDP6668692.1 tetratricopeptide repeat protein [Candidatus Krumholzibacteria bacterium]MDP6796696.1 tetratricopeptide repeat protein [Candidatus Krumholzibacteria bacterium]MDP7022405.1 tetratricopeptide repeat protein [Candidatus Krumholzibacteria bacterium]